MEEQKKILSYAEVRPKQNVFPNAERVPLGQILNKEIIIKDFKALPSPFYAGREFVVILAEHEGKLISFSCSEIVLKQLNEIKDKLPIRATITKQKRYYTLK